MRLVRNVFFVVSYIKHISKSAEDDLKYINGRPQQLDAVKALEQTPGLADITSRVGKKLRAFWIEQGKL